MVIVFIGSSPTAEHWNIPGFAFGDLIGFGQATFDGQHFDAFLLVQEIEPPEISLSGGAMAMRDGPFTFGEFNLSGDGITMEFTATMLTVSPSGRMVNVRQRHDQQ